MRLRQRQQMRAVLNAFRHQRRNHFSAPAGIGRTVIVLNAFRHQRRNHSGSRVQRSWYTIVLNAFRHQRRNHKDNVGVTPPINIQCSTPFGINEGITEFGPSQASFCNAVLNAFRHQRRNHNPDGGGAPVAPCAQRLSASTKESRSGQLSGSRRTRSAQRLSASTKESLRNPLAARTTAVVLNAFRHQRRNHFPATIIVSIL